MSQLKQVKREDFLTKLRALSADEEERDTQSASTYTTGAMDLGPASAGLSQQRRGMSFRSDATVKGGVPKGRRAKQTKAPGGPGRSGTSKQGQRTKALAKVEERDTQSASTYTTGAMDLGPASAGLSQQR